MSQQQNFKVNLLFQADTSAAVSNMQQLGQLLNTISSKTTIGVNSGPLQQAASAAQQLEIHLSKAVNVDTGKLNLTVLNSSLKASGTNLNELTSRLQAAGPIGQQAFMKIANAVAQAEVPMIRVNSRLKDFGVTIANTVKWQIASTAIHKVSSVMQQAVSHAEDLNRALNDIRIVTGYGTDTMGQFADRASAAARELSTTTTEYAKAALIFYQQGLNGDDVEERANTVVKLSQVTGQSAESVSSQMTAIWNNFEDGTHTLEYYADGLTKLGAATAASTDQIAAGLEKFAAVADTVGLSYEYAAASVATVVDKTQQSAEVVGTSFKTIFARMQGLELGETLEDGVDLNKYSSALKSVGIEVLNAEGELRDMDDILDDLGEKWEGFGKTTQVAIAQTVGGIRQYNQMISLMDNWDSVKENIELATNATGELQDQQEIWSESYEAASERVKKAQQDIYESFIDDEILTKLTDMFAAMLQGVSNFMDRIHGVGPLVLALAGIFSKTLFPMIQNGFRSLVANIKVFTGSAAKETEKMQMDMVASMQKASQMSSMSEGQQQYLLLTEKLTKAKIELAKASRNMTIAQQEEAQTSLANYENLVMLTQQTLEQKIALEQQLSAEKEKLNKGKTRKEVAETAALTTFRQDNQDRDEGEVDSIIDQATSTTRANTKRELLELEKQQTDVVAERDRLEKEIARTQQSMGDIWDNLGTVGKNNEERGERILKQYQEQQEKLTALKSQLEALPEADEERKQELQEILALQEDIIRTSQQKVEDMVVGEASTTAFDDNLFGRGEKSDVGQMETSMASQIQTELGATQDDMGNFSMDSSITNLEKLYTLMGQYKAQVAELTAIERDFGAALEITSQAENELAQSSMKQKKAIETVRAAESKYNKVIKENGKHSKEAKAAKKELERAYKELAKANEEVSTATKKNDAAQKTSTKTFTDSEKRIMELAKTCGMSKTELDKLNKSFSNLKNGTNVQGSIEHITKKLKEMKIASSDVDNSLDDLALSMRNSLTSAGFSGQQLENVISTLEKLSLITPEVANQMRLLGAAADENNNKFSQTSGKIMQGAQSVAQFAGTMAMAISAIQSMADAFNEGNSPLQTFSSLLMGLSMLLPIIIAASTKFTQSKVAEMIVDKAKSAIAKQELILGEAGIALDSKKAIMKGLLTGKTWAYVAAKTAEKIAENPVYGAIILAGIAAACVAIAAKTKETEKSTAAIEANNKAQMDNAESANELSSEWADQMGTMDNLIAKYHKLKDAGEDYSDVVQNIIDQAPDLIDSYTKVAEGLGIEIGDKSQFDTLISGLESTTVALKKMTDPEKIEQAVDEINEYQNELDSMISEEAAKQAQEGATAAMKSAANAIVAKGDAKIENDAVVRHVGGWNSIGGTEESASVDILEKAGLGTVDGTGAGIDVSLDMSDSSKFLEDYEALQAAAEQIESEVGTKNNDTYREVQEMLDASKEQYEKLKELQAEADKYGVFKAKSNLEKEGMDITNISSLEEYQKYKDALLNDPNVKGDPEAEKIAEQWLEANGAVQDYVEAEKKIDYIGNQVQKNLQENNVDENEAKKQAEAKKESIQKMYDSLDEDQKKLFLEVDVSKYQSEEAIIAEIVRLQNIAEQEEIQVKITAATTALDSLKDEGMTEDDWIKVRDSGIEWGKDGVMKFTEFLAMSYEEQSTYLERIKADQEALMTNSMEDSLMELQYGLDLLEASKADGTYSGSDEQYETERQAILDNVEALEGELAIRQKIQETKEIQEYGLDESLIQDLKESFNEVNSELEIFNEETGEMEKAALSAEDLNEANKDAAIRYARLNESLDDLNSNYESYAEVLEDVQDATDDVDKAMIANSKDGKALQKSLAGLLGTSEDLIDADLLSAIDPKDFKKAAEGDAEAIERIRKEFIRLQTEGIDGIDTDALMSELDALKEGVVVDINADTMPMLYKLIEAKVAAGAGAAEIEDLLSGMNIDADVTDFCGSMEEMKAASADAATEVIANTSFSQDVETTTVDNPTTKESVGFTEEYSAVPETRTSKILKDGAEELSDVTETYYSWKKVVTPTKESETENNQEQGTQVTTTNGKGETGQVKGVQIKNAHKSGGNKVSGNRSDRPVSSGGGGGGGGGGGSSKPTKDARKKKSDYVERYKKINDQLDDVKDKMEDASRAADTLWGPARLEKMKQVETQMKKEINLLKKKQKEAKKYLEEDKKNIDKTLADAAKDGVNFGLSFKFDKNGNISNIEQQQEKIFNQREALLDSFGAEIDEGEQEKLDAFDKWADEIKTALEQYDETKELVEDLDNEIEEAVIAWQENNFEQLNYKLEFEIEINESELELIEYYMGKIEEDIYSTAEAFAYLSQQSDIYTDSLAHQEEYVKQLEEDYYAGRITMADYKEGLKNAQSATIENLQALQQQKEAMQDYYGNVMDMALEKITMYTDEMDNLNSVLDHYSNIMDLVGKKEDYSTKKKILNSKATNLKNEMQVQKNLYEESAAEAQKWAEKMATATEGSNEYETYKKNWQAAQAAANEAQDAMLSKTEEWAETMKAVVEAELSELAKTMEESLTGGTSFDELLTSMERRSSLQEEYLTTTNQIYETNKLMRQAQQEIDKSSNSVAKKKLKNFIDETEQMQNQTELSQYELDIQQAKYDLLLAEIALEEAQSAKSTVRLQRDSEGNFGYVYTADQNAVDDAEQNLADKQNALYNIGLEGANEYSQKYAETMQEAQDAITELTEMWMNGEIESEEEFQRRKAEIQEYYYEKLKQYSNLYQVALTTDTNVIKDAWSTDFNDMIYSTDEWKANVEDYFEQAADSMSTWADVCATTLEQSGLDDLDSALGEIDSKSKDLTTTLIGEDGESGVVGAMMAEVEAAGQLSEAYIGIQNQIDETIAKYEELLGKINQDYTNPNTPQVPANPDDPDDDGDDGDAGGDDDGKGKTVKVGGYINAKGAQIYDYAGDTSGEGQYYGKDPKYKVLAEEGNWIKVRYHKLSQGVTGWFKKGDITALDTGGYTGDWSGSYGKMALLHKKELVLNEGDTENFLQGMSLLDKIVSVIDLYSMNSQIGGNLASPSLGDISNEKQSLDQQVHIEASFPGVSDRNEIEEALNNLVNKASQYANRK